MFQLRAISAAAVGLLFVFETTNAVAAEPISVTIDFAVTNGAFRPLHGINKGPLSAGGIVDLSIHHRELAPPFNRLHDCHWPVPDVVDMHVVFPNREADPTRPESYDFKATDAYLAAVRDTGAGIVYRLGESIEHTKEKRFVHPPRDVEKWTQACVGIIRHCNEGWANGHRLGIRYWEIWNEPENRPVMWTGTDDEFLSLYTVASRAIKAHDVTLKVGGPSFGYTGRFVGERFEASAFVTNFLQRCRVESLPLDFFSWHCYTADPAELVSRSRAIRALLDSFGFKKTESHLNEWNYLPDNSWTALSRDASAASRQHACDRMSGPEGAAFIAGALIALQDAPIDVCNLYHADVGCFGMFSEQGVPAKNFYAVRAFRELLNAPRRVRCQQSPAPGMSIAAGLGRAGEAQVLVATSAAGSTSLRIAFTNGPRLDRVQPTIRLVDAEHSFDSVPIKVGPNRIDLTFTGPTVALISLKSLIAP